MKYVCSIYDSRPDSCIGYPWNMANQIFSDCQFLNESKDALLSNEELLEKKTQEDINDYCISCGKCCFFGPAKCSKLNVVCGKSKTSFSKEKIIKID